MMGLLLQLLLELIHSSIYTVLWLLDIVGVLGVVNCQVVV